ncbi:MAG: queuosine precursor transporter [Bdellovibrionaceae bacterium]|nr:queuosine precursor transporter [Pseudobdellovibrionaceae bacterium]
MKLNSRRDFVYLCLAAFFVSNAVLAELIGGKLIFMPFELPYLGRPVASIGVVPWPVVLVATDIMNEYFGRDGVKRITLITSGIIAYCFLILYVAVQIPAADFSPVQDEVFQIVFGQSLWIIVGSLIAFMISQLVDVSVFWLVREKTGGKLLWLRSTGSTVVSQFIDSIVIIGIAFLLPGKITLDAFWNVSITNYSYKLLIAIALTPVIYVVHGMIDRYLGKEADAMISRSAKTSLEEALSTKE